MITNALRQFFSTLHRLLAVFLFLSLWEILPRSGIVDPFFLPPLSKVIATIFKMAQTGELIQHLAASLRRTLTGFSLGLSVSVPLGLLIGWFSRVERFADPLLQAFRQTSALALFPVFILFFGIGEASKS
ncbi:MAG: ABC transporter permease, partial [Bacillota bacterium]